MGNRYKGSTKNGLPAVSVSSTIPTKYQTVVIQNQEKKKGFSSQATRFPLQVSLNENPGPGSYGGLPSSEVISPSFSKKGTTGFVASKAARSFSNKHRGIPAPNTYNLSGSFIDKYDFNTGVSRVFRLPIAIPHEGPKHKTPAPNQYDVCGSVRESYSMVVGTSSFLSKTGRDSYNQIKNGPSPCHYEVTKSATQQQGTKAVLSPFKSTTHRIPTPKDYRTPGPGAYSPHHPPTPVKRTVLPRGYYLAISAPPMIVPKDPPLPGPGQYDIADFNGPPKLGMPTAAFASTTERLPCKDDRRPGPGFYDPLISTKQSFFYNDSRVWIPS